MAHRINANLVRRWIVRHRRELTATVAAPQATLLPVIMATATSSPGAPADDLVASAKRRRPVAATIEIELYGARIHLRGGVDAQALRRGAVRVDLDDAARRLHAGFHDHGADHADRHRGSRLIDLVHAVGDDGGRTTR
jgi:hypothetical protein